MKYKYTISILLLFITAINVFGQTTDNLKKPKYKRVSEAYGYLTGQEYSLDLIKKEFPQFEMSILKAQMSFNSTFGKSKEGMKKYLADYLGQQEFNQYEEKLMSELKKMLGNQTFTEEIATNFISEVESRAKGNIASTVLETLLSFQFSDRPQDELTSGFTATFKTKGHLKSKNTDWQIKVPKSWKAEEADRPNIIQKFTSDYGAGNQSIMLMVKEMPLPKGYKITKEELNDLFTEKEMKDMVPDGGKFISFTKMTLDNNIGGMIENEQTVERLDFKMKIRMVQFMFIRGDKWYFLQCSVGSEKTDTDLSLVMKKYLPLYRLVANTIVVNDQYK
jgi:hypothetical protein